MSMRSDNVPGRASNCPAAPGVACGCAAHSHRKEGCVVAGLVVVSPLTQASEKVVPLSPNVHQGQCL